MREKFIWDEQKNRSNNEKHGIWFEEAMSAFDDPNSRFYLDEDHLELEERYVLIGIGSTGRLLLVVHCLRRADLLVRIISARKATKREVLYYEKGI